MSLEETLREEAGIFGEEQERGGSREGKETSVACVNELVSAVGRPSGGFWGRQGIMCTESAQPKDRHPAHLPT